MAYLLSKMRSIFLTCYFQPSFLALDAIEYQRMKTDNHDCNPDRNYKFSECIRVSNMVIFLGRSSSKITNVCQFQATSDNFNNKQ